MTSLYLKSGNTFRVSSKAALDIQESLPAGNYVLKQDEIGVFFLEKVADFTIGGKCYGNVLKNVSRIIKTFESRNSSTGVMLTGDKGSGKTLLSKAVSVKAYEIGIPTIIINAPWIGDNFNSFIQSIQQSCIVLFDEFEKVYNREQQEHILTLLDGVFPTKKLFMLTCNDKGRVDFHLRNRPGRIFYMIEFEGLDVEFIKEYCEDVLIDKSHIEVICKISTLFSSFNFDILKAMVEEMNRYGETPQEVLKLLNAKPENNGQQKFTIQLTYKGKEIDPSQLYQSTYTGMPLSAEKISLEIDPDSSDTESKFEYADFTLADLKNVDPMNGKFTFINSNGDKVIFTKIEDRRFSFDTFAF